MIELIRSCTQRLKGLSHIECARLEAELIIAQVLGVDRQKLLILNLDTSDTFRDSLNKKIENLLQRRISGEPMAYILGRREFYGRDFLVGPGVLIPRPETETLVDLVLELGTRDYESLSVADIGAGSGAIGLTIAKELPKATVDLFELSGEAIEYIKKNSAKLEVGNCTIIQSDITKDTDLEKKYDVLVSNPPYISNSDPTVQEFVKKFEPSAALFSDQNGLRHIQEWAQVAANSLNEEGLLAFEVGIHQSEAVVKILNHLGFKNISVREDICGIPRCVYGYR
jgi:release factor glutamine methyltransferase